MTYISTWRSQLKQHLAEFAPLAKEDRSINLIYGITAVAVLWSVREAPYNEEHKAALREACGDEKHLPHLLKALGGWDDTTPLEAARKLSKRQSEDDALRDALTAVMGTFIDDLFAEKIIQRQHIDISGNIFGGNIIIGGYQIVAGDLIIQYTRPVISTCPTAPNPPDHFTGREQELRDLRAKLSSEGVVAITAVRAMGGMGKTTLAQALCHQPDKPFDAVLWASLGENPQTTNILLEWARYAVDDYTLKPDAKPEEIAAWVRGQLTQLINKQDRCGERWLVVFDDVWNNPTSYAAVALLQMALPAGIRTLITTRQADTASYLRASSIELYELSSDDALILLKRLSGNRHLIDDHLKRAVDIIKGHPLTLEIASASLNDAEDSADITAILDEYERGIRDGSPFDALDLNVETPRSLNVVFGRSYQALPADDQARFRALGIMPPDATWNRPLASALWGLEDERALTQAHKTLRLAAFIQQDETAEREYGGVYYRQHPLLRSYALALLTEAGELDGTFNHYAEYITMIAQGFAILPPEQWHQLDLYLPHIHAVGDDLAQRSMADDLNLDWLALAGDFSWKTMRYLNYRPANLFTGKGESRQPTRIRWFQMGLKAWQGGNNKKREAITLNNIGGMWSDLGEKCKALDFYEQTLPLLRAVADRRGEATTLNNIGNTWSALCENHKALEFYEQALALTRAVGDRGGEATTLTSIGSAWSALGEKRKALEFYEQALPLSRSERDHRGEATTLTSIGSAWSALGEKRKALEFYEQALALTRAVGDRSGEANTLNNIGLARSELGEQRTALAYYDQALPLRRAVGDRGGEANTLNNIGLAWFGLGEKHKALEFYEQALPLHRVVGNRGGEANTLNNIGLAWSGLGEKHKALEFYEQVLPLRQAVGDRGGEAITLTSIGLAWSGLGEKHKALEFYEQALPLCCSVGDRGGEAVTCYNMGMIYVHNGDLDKAIYYIERCVQLDIEIEHPDLESDRRTLEQLKAMCDSGGASPVVVQIDPRELETFVKNTIAVCTFAQDKCDEWRGAVQGIQQQAQSQNHTNEAAFFTVLLQVIDNKHAMLPDANPYHPYLQEVMDSIAGYVDGQETSEAKDVDSEQYLTEEALGTMVKIYQEQGEPSLRAMLKQNVTPDEAIDLFVMIILAEANPYADVVQQINDIIENHQKANK